MKHLYILVLRNLLIAIVILWTTVQAEFFSAISDLEKLIYTEQEVTITLQKYIELEEKRIQKIQKFSQQYSELYKTAENNKEMFLSNPVNAYVLLKHLTKDWKAATKLIRNSDGQNLINDLLEEENFPNQEDLSGAARALIRLQHIYLLDTEAMAQGRINGTQATFELTAADCFELGKQAFEAHLAEYSMKWMLETLKKLDKENIPTVDRVNVMEYITYSAYDIGNFSFGLSFLEEIIKIDPNHPRIMDNVQYYHHKFDEWKLKNSNQTIEVPEQTFEINGKVWKESEILKRYKHLCRGEVMKTPKQQSKLLCYRTTNDNNYFLIQPIKVEVLNLDPKLVMFHDVISNAESQEIKDTATPLLSRAVVQNTITGDIEVTTDRISKSTLLSDEEYEVSAKVNKRIEEIAGLSTEFSEPIHVINYGIGGHYEPHFDFSSQATQNTEIFRGFGNRIATWIFYLSDVLAGGSTVFPVIGVEVKPVKGSAAFWYNLYKNGTGNKNTLHAACPVLAGSKWVSNKWLHEKGQEFRRPCSLDRME